jgi:HNH endonuclease
MTSRKQPRGYLWPQVLVWLVIVGFSPEWLKIAEIAVTVVLIVAWNIKHLNRVPPQVKPVRDRYITQAVRQAVWIRDGGRCVQCGTTENLEFDHIIPFSLGGSNTKENTQLMCETDNKSKSNRYVG